MERFKSLKMYYQRPYVTRHHTRWGRRIASTIALEESIAFPEGGGQLSDIGFIQQAERTVAFNNSQKVFCRCVFRPDFPGIQVEGEVQLTLESPLTAEWEESQPIEVHVDPIRRAKLTRSHTAAHLVWIGLTTIIPNTKEAVRGCYIDPEGGRFDLRTERLGPDQVAKVLSVATSWAQADHPINLEELAEEPDCRIWEANGVRIPCGGTHLPRTGLVGPLNLQRRSKGKDLERIYYTLTNPLPEELLKMYG